MVYASQDKRRTCMFKQAFYIKFFSKELLRGLSAINIFFYVGVQLASFILCRDLVFVKISIHNFIGKVLDHI